MNSAYFNETDRYLITTDHWFIAPDGRQYRAVWGKVRISSDADLLAGIKTNARSTNWYAIVGDGDRQMMVAGCQIHYAVKSNNHPNTGDVKDYKLTESGMNIGYMRESFIYVAE